eukprot:352443-Karenia_brevis.AAC.1
MVIESSELICWHTQTSSGSGAPFGATWYGPTNKLVPYAYHMENDPSDWDYDQDPGTNFDGAEATGSVINDATHSLNKEATPEI